MLLAMIKCLKGQLKDNKTNKQTNQPKRVPSLHDLHINVAVISISNRNVEKVTFK